MKKLLVLLLSLALLLGVVPAQADQGAADVVMQGKVYHLTLDSVDIVDGRLTVVIKGYGGVLRWGESGPMVAGTPEARYGDEVVTASEVDLKVGSAFTFTFDRSDLPDEIWLNSYDQDVDPVLLWQAESGAAAEAPAESEPSTGRKIPGRKSSTPAGTAPGAAQPSTGRKIPGRKSAAPAEAFTPEPTEAPTPEPTPEPTAEPAPEPVGTEPEAGGWAVGDVVTFGRYEQDDNSANGAEPIEWIVLAADGDARLLLSRYGLAPMAYGDASGATWETSAVRSWLNGEFFRDAFPSEEQAHILESRLENPDNPHYGTAGGSDTTDLVFLLSIDELNEYLPVEGDRTTTSTDYAKASGAYTSSSNGNCWWWLRSPGMDPTFGAIVNSFGGSGGVYPNLDDPYRGDSCGTSDNCVRPALWVDPEGVAAPAESEAEPVQEPEAEPAAQDTLPAVLGALGEDVYRTTLEALQAGEVIERGSRGDTAKGVQQTLVAFGQGISVDGSVGPKTIAALNAVQAAFGLEVTEALDAAGYAELLPRLLVSTNPDAAEALLPGQLDEGEFEYMRACALVAQGKFASARDLFDQSRWGDWLERAEACVQPWPKTGVLYKNPAVQGSSTELAVQFNGESDVGMLVKIYTTDGTLARTMFIGGTGKATASLPAGTYVIKDGTGKNWYGEEEAFGKTGYYEIMTFSGGSQEIQLKRNYRSTITVNVQEDNPGADSVGADRENWEAF